MPRPPRVRLLDPRSWEDEPSAPVRRPRPVAVTTEAGKRVCAGCGVSLEGRRANTRYCEDRCRYLSQTYGLGLPQWQKLFDAQNGLCAICKSRQVMRSLAVDHDHRTGFVRGLLCKRCNQDLLTAGKHRASIFQAAADYLREPPALSVIGPVKPASENRSA